jgi:osmotically-inducible protein OsmY
MKKLVTQGILILGASGLLLYGQKTPPPDSQPPAGQTMGSDSQMSAKVHKALMEDSSTSSFAHGVKVSAHNGMVTLKGKVNSADEHDAILMKAKKVAGDSNVKDELTVANK